MLLMLLPLGAQRPALLKPSEADAADARVLSPLGLLHWKQREDAAADARALQCSKALAWKHAILMMLVVLASFGALRSLHGKRTCG